MGQELVKFYDEAGKLGMKARLRLAMKTGVPSEKAKSTPDSPDMVKKFKTVMEEIKREF
jgi:hypothetical protein